MGDPRDDERDFDETEFEIGADDDDLNGLQKLDENGDPIEDDEEAENDAAEDAE